ncbi:hypothetical protein ACFE04_011006 [Oxalis oulophora]
MGISITDCIKGAWSVPAKPCDSCKSATAVLFCRHDSAFLCLNCDSRIHGINNKLALRHERVWMCEVCEQAPAAVTCKADAAALCVSCDNDIHSANPLARRHERVPVEPFYDSTESLIKSSHFSTLLDIEEDHSQNINGGSDFNGVQEPGSWLLPTNPIPTINNKIGVEINNNNCVIKGAGDFFFTETEPFMDFDYPNSFHQHNLGSDSVVPVQTKSMAIPVTNNENCFDIDFCRNKLSAFNYNQSLSQSVSSSSLDVGVVPDGNNMSDISYPYARNTIAGQDRSVTISAGATTTTTSQATQLSGTDREARVMRYREKRKNRKFEKTIRYASRKAYAETRPRIKGRFAKRTEMDSDLDQLYGSAVTSGFIDFQYGVVPSF